MSNADFPPSDSFQGSDETIFSQGHDRRRVIKFGTVAAGAAFLTPTLLTLGASPASASGTASFSYANTSNTADKTQVINVSGAGLWVVFAAARNNTSSSLTDAATFLDPDGWTPLFSQYGTDTTSVIYSNRLTVKAWYRYVASGASAPGNTTFAYTGGGASQHRGLAGYQFPGATSVSGVTTSSIGSAVTASTAAASSGSSFLYAGVFSGTGTPTIAASGIAAGNSSLNVWGGNNGGQATMAIGMFSTGVPGQDDEGNDIPRVLFPAGTITSGITLTPSSGTIVQRAAFACAIA